MTGSFLEYWIVFLMVIIGIFLFLCLTVMTLIRREQKFFRERVLLKSYTDLFEAVSSFNGARGDVICMESAMQQIGTIMDRLNLVVDPEVLLKISELLNFLNESRDKKPDPAEEYRIVSALTRVAGKNLDPSAIRELEEARRRFRLDVPPRQL